ncbi:unannotated protein [freshwater metagenome]|uniref:Unannotated protein n=1 Tax=freshwater metagenome TaxID=449393 RepID=A0A6J7D4P5_9ZZZZ
MHQAAEYVMGIAFVAQGLQSTTPMVPTLMGGLVVLNTACAKGSLSAFQVFGRRMHRTLDVVVILAVIVAAAQPFVSIDNATRGIMGFLAFALAFIWLQSDFSERVTRAERVKSAKQAKQARSAATAPPAPNGERASASASASPDSRAATIGRTAGRMVGSGVNAYRKRKG